MFLLNLIDADFLQKIQKFTIQNVPIKLPLSIKILDYVHHLQYKMFLLNEAKTRQLEVKKTYLQYKMFLLNGSDING